MNQRQPKKEDNPWRAAVLIGAVGVDLAACMGAGYFAGRFASGRLGDPVWIIAGIMLGFVIGLVSVVYLIKRFMEDNHG